MTNIEGSTTASGSVANKIAYTLIGLLVLMLAYAFWFDPSGVAEAPQNIVPSGGQVAEPGKDLPCGAVFDQFVSIDQLAGAYHANEAAAQRDYGDRCVAVAGTVEGVYLDIVDDPSVRLELGADDTVNVGLVEAAYPLTVDLQKGQTAYFLCADISEFLGDPTLSDCVFAEAKPQ